MEWDLGDDEDEADDYNFEAPTQQTYIKVQKIRAIKNGGLLINTLTPN